MRPRGAFRQVPLFLWKVISLRKIRWFRVFGAMVCLAAVIGGSVYAYSTYAEDTARIEELKQIYNYDVLAGKKAEPVQANEKIPAFPLAPEVVQANQDKIKRGEFIGVKAVVFVDRKAPGQESPGRDSGATYYDKAFWGSGAGVENHQFVRVKLTDSDRTKLDLLAAQHTGQYAGYEIEFFDNDGHFTVNRLLLCGGQEAQPQQ